jgi:rhamnose utilization protein RhaD (predicted bifunctional aldolase and dehydrogenase)
MGDLAALVGLARALGDPGREFAILGEGNTSIRTGDDTMLVKASGASLSTAGPEDFVSVPISRMLSLVASSSRSSSDVDGVFAEVAAGGRRPSVEAMLHAVCLDAGASVVGHTHPVAVNAILCSVHAERLATDVLFPDQVVVLGPDPLFFPYIDPGLALARAVHAGLSARDRPPRIIYLANHGLFALGRTPNDVLQITEMAVKAARVLAGALAVGGLRPLPPEEVARIDRRPDEAYRRQVLSSTSGVIGRE